jgi:hypothetical protein
VPEAVPLLTDWVAQRRNDSPTADSFGLEA